MACSGQQRAIIHQSTGLGDARCRVADVVQVVLRVRHLARVDVGGEEDEEEAESARRSRAPSSQGVDVTDSDLGVTGCRFIPFVWVTR